MHVHGEKIVGQVSCMIEPRGGSEEQQQCRHAEKKNKKKKLCVCRLRLHAAAERGCLLVVTPEYDTIQWI